MDNSRIKSRQPDSAANQITSVSSYSGIIIIPIGVFEYAAGTRGRLRCKKHEDGNNRGNIRDPRIAPGRIEKRGVGSSQPSSIGTSIPSNPKIRHPSGRGQVPLARERKRCEIPLVGAFPTSEWRGCIRIDDENDDDDDDDDERCFEVKPPLAHVARDSYPPQLQIPGT